MRRIRILLADDHGWTLDGLRVLLEAAYEIVGDVADGKSLVDAAIRLKPDMVISDITMPRLNGIEATIEIRKHLPRVKVLLVTMHRNTAYLASALKAGAMGYVLKTAANEELLEAVANVLKGQLYVSPGVTAENLERFRDPARAADTLNLSNREREILLLIAAGNTAKEIGAVLAISPRTVVFHRENIRHKLGIDSTADLTRYALEQRIGLSPGEHQEDLSPMRRHSELRE